MKAVAESIATSAFEAHSGASSLREYQQPHAPLGLAGFKSFRDGHDTGFSQFRRCRHFRGNEDATPAAIARWDRHQLRTSDQTPGRVADHRHVGQLHRRRIRSIATGCPSFPIRGDGHQVPAASPIVARWDRHQLRT
jgi:hypothetical protein